MKRNGRVHFRTLPYVVACLSIFTCNSEARKPASAQSGRNAEVTIAGEAELSILSGKFAPEKKSGFAAIPAKFAAGRTQYLDERTLAALVKLAAAAHAAGFDIQVVSATRNFVTQKAIWEQKFSGQRAVGGKNLALTVKDEEKRALEILRFSSMPGTSRHHWGTDLDLHEAKITAPALHNSTFKKGRGKEFHDWLTANAPAFGFCQPYTGDPAERNGGKYAHGYQEERWHWSYRPVSADYLRQYEGNAAALQPKGYAGDKAAAHLYMHYVQNIDPTCR